MSKWISLGPLFEDVCRNRSRGNTESTQAFQTIKDRLTDSQVRVWGALRDFGPRTVDELAVWLSTNPNSISGRITELKIKGKIEKIGTRPTRSGCSAAVWRAI